MTTSLYIAAIAALTAMLPVSVAPSARVAGDDDLIAADPAAVSIDTPAPGHVDSWTMTARNVTDAPVGLGLDVIPATGEVFAGPHPLQVIVTDDAGQVLLTAADFAGGSAPVVLPVLPAGAQYVVTGHAEMPVDAGDEYRGAGGRVTLRFIATANPEEMTSIDPPLPGGAEAPEAGPGTEAGSDVRAPGTPQLAWTGSDVLTVLAVAVAVIGLGTAVLGAMRRRRSA